MNNLNDKQEYSAESLTYETSEHQTVISTINENTKDIAKILNDEIETIESENSIESLKIGKPKRIKITIKLGNKMAKTVPKKPEMNVRCFQRKPKNKRIIQGTILQNVDFIEYFKLEEKNVVISKVKFPYVYVLSQDCDLNQDFNFRKNSKGADKRLISILVAPMYNFEQFKTGNHLDELNMKMMNFTSISSTELKMLYGNKNSRFHFLAFNNDVKLPDLVIDFKHYFSVSYESLYNNYNEKYLCEIKSIFRENISKRFSEFLSRIGLPVIK